MSGVLGVRMNVIGEILEAVNFDNDDLYIMLLLFIAMRVLEGLIGMSDGR